MKKLQHSVTLLMISGLIFSTGLFAQEQTEVTLKVKKDGKIVKDTTYSFDDDKKAEHFIMVADAMSKEGMEGMHFSGDNHFTHEVYMDSKDGKTVKKMIFIDGDGNKEIKEYHGDSLVWISEEGHGEHAHGEHGHSEHMQIIHKELKDSGGGEGKTKVYVISTDGEEGMKTFDIMESDENVKVMKIKEDGELITIMESEDGGEKRVEVKVIKTGEGDEEGTWTVSSDDDENVIIIKTEEKIIKEEKAPKSKKTKKQ